MNSDINFMKVNSKLILHNIYNLRQLIFEVTDACNLKCVYCAYSDLYDIYDNRQNKFMSFEQSKIIIDYLIDLWQKHSSIEFPERLTIGFYGGEPLLNFSLIKQIVEYINGKGNFGKIINYNLTTNAILLNKYIDFFVQNNFYILVSFDGDEYAQSYRVNGLGINSFSQVFMNIKNIRNEYPEYFIKHINFNSVLHSRNDVGGIYDFFKNNFSKIPRISLLSNNGIREDKKNIFSQMCNDYYNSFMLADNNQEIEKAELLLSPTNSKVFNQFERLSGNSFYDYNDFVYDKTKIGVIPTGTCIPFSKKMFITVNCKILHCEKISHHYSLGYIKNKEVMIDIENVAYNHNNRIFKFIKYCKSCAYVSRCSQCIYRIDGVNNDDICLGYISKQEDQRISFNELIERPGLLTRIYNMKMIR